jgi:hypothetical protein
MKVSTVRDLLGEPTSWGNHISDGTDDMPPMDGATILDVFSSGRQLSVYTRSLAGAEALSLFLIENAALCARIAEALKPGLDIHKALATPID